MGQSVCCSTENLNRAAILATPMWVWHNFVEVNGICMCKKKRRNERKEDVERKEKELERRDVRKGRKGKMKKKKERKK